MDYKKPLIKNQLERFAFMLRHKRKERGLTISKLAYKLGYSVASISNWENKKQKPDLYKVEDVAIFFEIPLNILIREE